VAVDEFGPELENVTVFPEGAYAAADAIASFEDENLSTSFGETPGSGEAGHSGTDYEYALSDGFHLGIGCDEGSDVIANCGHAGTPEDI
jgi:hypothetical protein